MLTLIWSWRQMDDCYLGTKIHLQMGVGKPSREQLCKLLNHEVGLETRRALVPKGGWASIISTRELFPLSDISSHVCQADQRLPRKGLPIHVSNERIAYCSFGNRRHGFSTMFLRLAGSLTAMTVCVHTCVSAVPSPHRHIPSVSFQSKWVLYGLWSMVQSFFLLSLFVLLLFFIFYFTLFYFI